MIKVEQRAGYWWVVSGERFRMYPFPTRADALSVVELAKPVAGSAAMMEDVF